MKQHLNSLLALVLLAFLAAFTQTGCKENVILNSRVLPIDSNVIEIPDTTFQVLSKTVLDTNVITSGVFPGIDVDQGIGSFTDPYFGTTNASMYVQVIPSTLSFSFAANNYTIDSAVLIVPYGGYSYGDTTNTSATQTYQVFRVLDSLSIDSNYYATTRKAISTTPYSDPISVNLYHLKDSVNVNGINVAPHMRLKLNANFISDMNSAPSSDFTDYPTFLNWFRGLCIVADSTHPGQTIPYFRIDGVDQYTEANVLIYYHDANGVDTSTSFFFNTEYCAHYNHITRNYNGSQAQTAFQSTAASDPVVGLQDQPGASIDIKIGNLTRIPTSIINRAQIAVTVLNSQTAANYYGPSRLYVTGVGKYADGTDSLYTIADRYPLTSTSSFEVLDGTSYTVNGAQQYQINIPRELQNAVIAHKDTLHLRISGTQDYYGAYRIIAGGGNNSDPNSRLKFKVVYSKTK